jgi:peptidylprolyl isomerase
MTFRFAAALVAVLALCPALVASPALAAKRAPAKAVAPPPSTTPTAADFRAVDPENMLVVDTNKGRIIVELYPFAAPNHVAQIKTLAKQHFYDGLTFFRVIDEFMDQTGDPTNKGDGDSKLPNIKAEFTFRRGPDLPFTPVAKPNDGVAGFIGALPVTGQSDDLMALTADGKVVAWPLYCSGVMGMARNSDPDSANSQFFFMRGPYPSLEKKYTAWGRVIVGEDVVRAIKTGEPVADPQDKMLTVRLGSDLAPVDRPKVYVLDTQSAVFKAMVDKARADKGADLSACDIEIPAQVR